MWPKTVYIRGIGIPVNSWEELDEIVIRYGGVDAGPPPEEKLKPPRTGGSSNPADRALLKQFVEGGNRGIATGTIGQALGKQGKSIRPALAEWSRRVGLADKDVVAFEANYRTDGRGYRLLPHFLRVAQDLLER